MQHKNYWKSDFLRENGYYPFRKTHLTRSLGALYRHTLCTWHSVLQCKACVSPLRNFYNTVVTPSSGLERLFFRVKVKKNKNKNKNFLSAWEHKSELKGKCWQPLTVPFKKCNTELRFPMWFPSPSLLRASSSFPLLPQAWTQPCTLFGSCFSLHHFSLVIPTVSYDPHSPPRALQLLWSSTPSNLLPSTCSSPISDKRCQCHHLTTCPRWVRERDREKPF